MARVRRIRTVPADVERHPDPDDRSVAFDYGIRTYHLADHITEEEADSIARAIAQRFQVADDCDGGTCADPT
jgi:hypothetical protein